jgi:hypothetical protein
MNGSSFCNSSSGVNIFTIKGDFTMTGTSYITNSPTYSYVFLNNSSSTFANPQHISFTTTGVGNWCSLFVNAGCYTQMTSNCYWTASSYPIQVDGTLDCQGYSWTNGYFRTTTGSTLYTSNATGINGAITTTGTRTFSSGTRYVFNGAVAQTTGTLLPTSLSSPGGLTVNNAAGVTLSGAAYTQCAWYIGHPWCETNKRITSPGCYEYT